MVCDLPVLSASKVLTLFGVQQLHRGLFMPHFFVSQKIQNSFCRFLTTIVHGWIIALVAGTTATSSCSSSPCQSTWPPFLSYAWSMCSTTGTSWQNRLFWYLWSSWPLFLYSLYPYLDWLVFISSSWVAAGRPTNKSLENFVGAIIPSPRTVATTAATLFVDHNIQG